MTREQLIEMENLLSSAQDDDAALDGFDLDIVGFDCVGEMEWGDDRTCPFTPGCGRKLGEPCELEKQRAILAKCPKQIQ